MKKKKQWYDYLWIWAIIYFALGFFNILFAWFGMIDFLLPLGIAVFGGNKFFCNHLCGRGQLFSKLGGDLKCSRNKQTPLRRLIAHGENATYCLGIVGSGNRNFNKQFCLTAHQYAQDFGFPVLDEFELRGSQEDLERIGDKLVKVFQTATKTKGVAYVQN